ncbi:MAG: MFS transporter [Prochlorotrichaceae cyanobacterium]|jgi:GPH family glycoside/pentoside/hexuronide:cation symporter
MAQTASAEKLSLSTKLAFGAGDWGTALTANLQLFSLLYFFTNVAGLNPALAGYVLLTGKIWDAINDPLMGVLSDRTRNARWGRRYPWMLWGAIPLGVSFFLLWVIPTDRPGLLFVYYVIVSLVFNTAFTMVNLPYSTLTTELTSDYDERTSLNSFRFFFSIGGSIFSLLLLSIASQLIPNQRDLYFTLGWLSAVIAILPIYWCIWGTKERTLSRPQDFDTENTIPFWQQVQIAFSNRPFLLVIGIYLCSWMALQFTATVIPYFVVSWMRMPESAWPTVALTVQSTAMVTLFIWTKVSERFGKKVVYFLGMGLWIIAQGGLFFMQPGQVGLLYSLAIVAGCGVSTGYLVPWSMLPDVVDLDELNTGQRREGIFYSFMVLLQKLSLAIALAGLGQGLSWAGFVQSEAGSAAPVQPDSALWVIRFVIGPVPTVFLAIGLVLAYLYPISRELHSEILLKLRERHQLLHPD